MTADTAACEGAIDMLCDELSRLQFGLSLITPVHPQYRTIQDRIAECERKIGAHTANLAQHREAA